MYGWRPYVPVAKRRAEAARQVATSKKSGVPLSPVVISGRTIASSFWGKSWCDAMESYGDYENRLPRGRTYVRNGSVVDLRVEPGLVTAMVSGSEVYRTTVRVKPLAPARWKGVVEEHAGQVSSLVDLLQGKLPASLLRSLCDASRGLFPGPRELEFACSCPDWALMCKHVAAVLYGVGARLDHDPGLLFVLRGVEATDLAARSAAVTFAAAAGPDELTGVDLGDLFGIDLGGAAAPVAPSAPEPPKLSAAKATPAKAAPAKATPAKAPPAKAAPVKAAPVKPAPAKAAPVKAAPVKPAPVKPAPAKKPAPAPAPAPPAVQAVPAKPPRAGRRAPAPAPVPFAPLAASMLDRLRVDRETVAGWVRSGVLLATADPAVYTPTEATGPHLRAYMAENRGR